MLSKEIKAKNEELLEMFDLQKGQLILMDDGLVCIVNAMVDILNDKNETIHYLVYRKYNFELSAIVRSEPIKLSSIYSLTFIKLKYVDTSNRYTDVNYLRRYSLDNIHEISMKKQDKDPITITNIIDYNNIQGLLEYAKEYAKFIGTPIITGTQQSPIKIGDIYLDNKKSTHFIVDSIINQQGVITLVRYCPVLDVKVNVRRMMDIENFKKFDYVKTDLHTTNTDKVISLEEMRIKHDELTSLIKCGDVYQYMNEGKYYLLTHITNGNVSLAEYNPVLDIKVRGNGQFFSIKSLVRNIKFVKTNITSFTDQELEEGELKDKLISYYKNKYEYLVSSMQGVLDES